MLSRTIYGSLAETPCQNVGFRLLNGTKSASYPHYRLKIGIPSPPFCTIYP